MCAVADQPTEAPEHWRNAVEMDTGDPRLLGEDQWGDLWVPSRRRSLYWDRRFNPRNPLHWRAYLRSRRRHRLAFLETA